MRLPLRSPLHHPHGYLLFVLLVLFVVCLWPFNFLEPNNVAWNVDGGLHFSAPGTAYTRDHPVNLARLETFTILLHLAVDNPGEASWIASYGHDYDRFNFMIGQHSNQLVFEMRTMTGRVNTRIRVPRPFEENREARIAIVYDGRRLSAFIGGERKADTRLDAFDNTSWTAESPLVFGSGANGKFPWNGTIYRFTVLGMALYAGALRNTDSVLSVSTPVVDYLFNEGHATTAADHDTGSTANLTIPSGFDPYARSVLLTPKVYWLPIPLHTDIIGNILAFIPVGFLFASLLASRLSRAWLVPVAAIALTFFTSLGIELLQSLLPSRWSTVMDVFTNTLGGAIGAFIFARSWVGSLFTRLGISFRDSQV